jgi:hypothetical protein
MLSAPCFDIVLGAVSVMYTVNSDLLFPPGGWQLSWADSVMQSRFSRANPNLIAAQGFGDADPIASNDTPEGQAKNRRVELTL